MAPRRLDMRAGERRLGASRVKEVFLVQVTPGPVRDTRRDDQQALEEIRRLFARYRQVAASYYYGEIAERGLGIVLKEMALIAMHLASLNPGAE